MWREAPVFSSTHSRVSATAQISGTDLNYARYIQFFTERLKAENVAGVVNTMADGNLSMGIQGGSTGKNIQIHYTLC